MQLKQLTGIDKPDRPSSKPYLGNRKSEAEAMGPKVEKWLHDVQETSCQV